MVITFCLVVHSNELLPDELAVPEELHSDMVAFHNDGFGTGVNPTRSIFSFPDIVLFIGL